MEDLSERAAKNLEKLREKKPLIHNITNLVVMNYTANALLAMGASPVMTHSQSEVEEIVSIASALILNIGTLNDSWIPSMIKAGKKASALGIPVILDPVGSGATSLRTVTARRIIEETNIAVICGNASEILSLRLSDAKTRGVDTIHSVEDALETATMLAEKLNATLAITGPTDLITDGKRVIRVFNGHPLMASVTGTGCTATVTIGAFLAVDKDALSATTTALSFFGLAGEVAGEKASAPGSYMIELINALHTITPEMLQNQSKIEESVTA